MSGNDIVERYKKFFEKVTRFKPYDWQLNVAQGVFKIKDTGGIVLIEAETGSGKTEASTLPGLFLGRQVIIVEPFRALIEDMVLRFENYLLRLSEITSSPYTLGVDYGGRHYIYECSAGKCTERVTRKPFGADVLITTMDEMVYRILSIGTRRKASLYTSLIRVGRPIIFFDEAHSYSAEPLNPLATLVHLVTSLSLLSPVVLASATLPECLRSHIETVVARNGVHVIKERVPPKPKQKTKARVELDSQTPQNKEALVSRIIQHVNKYINRGHKTILVRVVEPETAYRVYSELSTLTKDHGYNLGILHGRMPIRDREKVFRRIKEDMNKGEKLILVTTSVIEAGVDLDFDAGVIELTPYRSLEQTLGRINRKYQKDSEVTILETEESTWKILETEDYLREVREKLQWTISSTAWEDIRDRLKAIDEKHTEIKLSAANLLEMYDSPYSKMLAISLYSLFHLEGTFLEHLLALSKTEYETRGEPGIVAEVEGEPGNCIRIPKSITDKLKETYGIDLEKRIIPKRILRDHNYYTREGEKVEAQGLVIL